MSLTPEQQKKADAIRNQYMGDKRQEIQKKVEKDYADKTDTSPKPEDTSKPSKVSEGAKKAVGAAGDAMAKAAEGVGRAMADVQQSIINEAGPKKRAAKEDGRNRGSIGG